MKYPRTPHLPNSPGMGNNDKSHKDIKHFINKNLIITEKMDGSNICLTRNGLFSRSHNGPPTHASFDWLKGWHSGKKFSLPDDIYVYGEYTYAVHSIKYNPLPHYVWLFGVLNINSQEWLPWGDVKLCAQLLGCETVPVLMSIDKESTQSVEHLETLFNHVEKYDGKYGTKEGYVVRNRRGFKDSDFYNNVSKWVRSGHVADGAPHWSKGVFTKQQLA